MDKKEYIFTACFLYIADMLKSYLIEQKIDYDITERSDLVFGTLYVFKMYLTDTERKEVIAFIESNWLLSEGETTMTNEEKCNLTFNDSDWCEYWGIYDDDPDYDDE